MLNESITFQSGVPFEVTILEAIDYPIHYHEAFEIILVLEGSVLIKDGYDVAKVEKDNMWFIDSADLHSISQTQGSNKLLIVHLDLDFFISFFPDIKKTFFASIADEKNEYSQKALRTAREQLLNIVLNRIEGNDSSLRKAEDIAIKFIDNIIDNFRYFALNDGRFVNEIDQKENKMMAARMQRIINYIYDNFDRNLTLNEIADEEHLNVYYLSHIIKDATQMSFRDLLNLVRVENSEKMLLSTDKKISEIALESGFSANRYYLENFKKWYYMDPEEYRRINKPKSAHEILGRKRVFDQSMYKELIMDYANRRHIEVVSEKKSDVKAISVEMGIYTGNFRSPLQNALILTNIASLIRDDTYRDIKSMKRDFKLVKVFIEAETFTEAENENAAYVTIATNIDYLIKEEVVPCITIDTLNSTTLKNVERFILFYCRRFKGDVEEIEFAVKYDTKNQLNATQEWAKKLERRLYRIVGEKPSIVLELNEGRSYRFASCLYDSYIFAAFSLDELLTPAGWDISIDCAAIDPVKSDGNIFEGGYGLLTWNGIRKPWYYAYLFLSRVEGKVLGQGDGYIIVDNNGIVSIVTYNLGGYSPSYIKKIRNREELGAFIDTASYSSNHKIKVVGLKGRYKVTCQKLDLSNCLFSKWRALEYPDYLSDEEERALKHNCFPSTGMSVIDIDGDYDTICSNDSFGIEKIRLEPM